MATSPTASSAGTAAAPKRTPLFELHRARDARLVPFAGYEMPLQYPSGILAEHRHTRSRAGLFDVSHMGQIELRGPDCARALERLLPADIDGLAVDRQRYSFFTNERGGILDDLMIARTGEAALLLIVNAACKHQDAELLRAGLSGSVEVVPREDLALLALQGPEAAAVLARLAPAVADMAFMESRELSLDSLACRISRSGYTGEDGYEISVPADHAMALAERLLAEPEVAPVGLGARDSLRLEAGLCLYGHDLDRDTTPVEAELVWAIQKRRREAGDFPGGDVIRRQMAEGPPRLRVGLRPEGRAPVREGAVLSTDDGREVGRVTSGGFGPTVEAPIAMGYVAREIAAVGGELTASRRGRSVACRVCPLPFVPHNYHRKTSRGSAV